MTIVEQIVRRELPAVIVFENDNIIAFMDHDPISRGHVLICPKAHYRQLIDVPVEVHNELMQVAREIYQRIKDKYQPDGITLFQCNGQFNELDHYHLHIFPRMDGDGFGWLCQDLGGIQTVQQLTLDAEGLSS